MAVGIVPGLPVLIPDPVVLLVRPRPANAGPVHSLSVAEGVPIKITHREMGRIEVAHRPARWIGRLKVDPDPEEGQLITKAATIGSLQIASVVPPFDLVVGMARVIACKVELVRRKGSSPGIGLRRRQ